MTLEERIAYAWTLRSPARVGSYQHELSSGPWMILFAEQTALTRALERDSREG